MLKKNSLSGLRSVFAVGFILTISMALTSYIDSSFLDTFISKSRVGLLFTASAFASLVYIAYAPRILQEIGVSKTLTTVSGMYVLSILGITTFQSHALIEISFIIYWVSAVGMYMTVDFLVSYYSDEQTTGNTRGFYLTIYNLAFLIAPFIAGILVDSIGFRGVYFVSGLFVVCMTYFFIHRFEGLSLYPKKNGINFFKNFIELFKVRDLRNVYLVNFALNFFFSVMTIYMPIYLFSNMNFSWQEIGAIFAIMHTPYVLLEIPWGKLADQILGEKEIMGAGIIIIGLCTVAVGLITSNEFWVWAAALSLTRVGASMVQVTIESYFFKKINKEDTNKISVFRNAAPIAMLVAPAIASGLLGLVSLSELFIILGALVLLALIPNYKLNDTK